jgi:hypothetical protein
MSNLAAKYLKAGFLEDAIANCKKALAMENPHKNVGLTWAEAMSASDAEADRLDKLMTEARETIASPSR